MKSKYQDELNRVLVVDDDKELGELIVELANDLGFVACSETDKVRFEQAYDELCPTVLFVDLQMPGTDGIEILNFLHSKKCSADIFMISGFDSRVLKSARDFGRSKGLNVRDALQKPISIVDLESALKSAQKHGREFTDAEIVSAIENDELFVRYQPKLALSPDGDAKGSIVGGEALVRWQHPKRGEIPPDRFLPLIEASNLMVSLTDRVLDCVIQKMIAWADKDLHPTIAINLSPSLLVDSTLPDRFEEIVRDANLDPSQIVFEITESAVMSDVSSGAEILTRFRLKGFGLSIDDFGTGFSSLVELYRLPFNELKIDKTFTLKAIIDQEAEVIVSLLTELTHRLGMSVCAEGVENKETLDYLIGLGCDTAQGYFIGRPLLPNEFEERLESGT